jgi:hypothetical protein
VEAIEIGEFVEITSIHATFMQGTEKMAGWQKWLGEYPTLSAIVPAPIPASTVCVRSA